MHGLRHVGRAEIDNHGSRLRGSREEKVVSARGGLQGLGQRRRLESEVQETGAGNLHRLTYITDRELGDHVVGQQARVKLPGLGQRHEGIGLVVAEFRVRAWADLDCGDGCVWQYSLHRLLEALFYEFVGEHRLKQLKELRVYKAAKAEGVPMQPCKGATNLFLPLAADDLQHSVGVGRLFEGLAEFRPMQQLGNVGQCVKMFRS